MASRGHLNRSRRIDAALWSSAALVAFAVVVVSVTADPDIPSLRFPAADKVGHAVAYSILTGLLLLAGVWRPGRIGGLWKGPLPAIAIAVAYGWILEALQSVVGRDAQVLDGLADLLGASLAVVIWDAARRRSPGAAEAKGIRRA